MSRKKQPEPLIVEIPEPKKGDPCFCCAWKEGVDGKCEHEDDCTLLNDDLNKDSEQSG